VVGRSRRRNEDAVRLPRLRHVGPRVRPHRSGRRVRDIGVFFRGGEAGVVRLDLAVLGRMRSCTEPVVRPTTPSLGRSARPPHRCRRVRDAADRPADGDGRDRGNGASGGTGRRAPGAWPNRSPRHEDRIQLSHPVLIQVTIRKEVIKP
jgi:hypothetical protein